MAAPAKQRLTKRKKERFLQALSEIGNVSRAAKVIGVTRQALYQHRAKDPEFAEAWAEAEMIGADSIEEEVFRRGAEGWEEPVHYKGEVVDTVRKYSDTLAIFLLKGLRPDKYRERSTVDHTIQDNRDLRDKPTDELWAQLRASGLLPEAQVGVNKQSDDN